MKTLHHLMAIAAGALCHLHADAQITFPVTDLPNQTNDYYRAYYSTNVNVAALLGGTNGPQYWDFSQPQKPNEIIRRTDIILPNDVGGCGYFANATYAERDTDEPSSQIAWRYYSLTNQGRLYYGFYNPINDPVTPCVGFDHPTLDVPVSVQLGQTWNRSVAWTNTALIIYQVAYHFSTSAKVDAYGTVALPGIGQIPALRVKEVENYQAWQYDIFFGDWLYFLSQTNIYYYWLAEGIGFTAQLVLIGDNTVIPTPAPHTNYFLRVFESSNATNPPSLNPVTGLRVRVESGLAKLDWNSQSNSSGYQVDIRGVLSAGNWQVSGLPVTNSWFDTLTATQRFYRVFWKP